MLLPTASEARISKASQVNISPMPINNIIGQPMNPSINVFKQKLQWHRPIIHILLVYPMSFHLEHLHVLCTVTWPKEVGKVKDISFTETMLSFSENYVLFLKKLSFLSQKPMTSYQSLKRELMPTSAKVSYHVNYMIATCCGVYFVTTNLMHKNH